MKYLLIAALASACAGRAAAAYDEEGLSEAAISTDAVKNGDEDEAQPFVQENDEDLAAFVTDYIRRDTSLKGAFLLEDAASGKILKLHLVSVDRKAQTGSLAERTVTVVMGDAAGKKFTIVFHLQIGPWGGLDIFRLEIKKIEPAKKTSGTKG